MEEILPAHGSDDPSRELTEGALLALREVAIQLLKCISEEDIRTAIREVLEDLPDRGETLPSSIAESYAQELFALQREVDRLKDGANALIAYLDGGIDKGGPTGG
ncbi:hypothetical protein [Novosphingobium kaempferiae]|uniref:hypothetical protein n=1 Tax=Novosphingobium kaempferiae TaxID=2896849 RepID=UPI001E4BA3DD|nr:hypothetical protein [Novosphingobium kaempferiae]